MAKEGTRIGDYIYTKRGGKTYKRYSPIDRKQDKSKTSKTKPKRKANARRVADVETEDEVGFLQRLAEKATGTTISRPTSESADRRAAESETLLGPQDESARARIRRHKAKKNREKIASQDRHDKENRLTVNLDDY